MNLILGAVTVWMVDFRYSFAIRVSRWVIIGLKNVSMGVTEYWVIHSYELSCFGIQAVIN